MKLIYVAGKYASNRPEQIDAHIERARHAGAILLAKGWAPVIPHTLFAHGDKWQEIAAHYRNYDPPKDYMCVFLKAGLALLLQCDAIFMLRAWEDSHGACNEYNLAVALGLEIYHEDEGYPHPNSTRHEPEVLEP